jgi:hypothetical protein
VDTLKLFFGCKFEKNCLKISRLSKQKNKLKKQPGMGDLLYLGVTPKTFEVSINVVFYQCCLILDFKGSLWS